MELTTEIITLLLETDQTLRGRERRLFRARTVDALGPGGLRQAERILGWDHKTVQKGLGELRTGVPILDNFSARGRKATEFHLPTLLDDIRAIVDPQSQTDPTFKTQRLYRRHSAAEVRRQLIETKGYDDESLPSERTISTKLNQLGYRPARVAKSKPKKRSLKPTRSSSD